MTTSRNQIRRTSVNNSPPTGLLPGELAVEMGKPTRLWLGVPASIDPAKQKLVLDVDALAALTADEATKAPLVHTHVIADTTGLQTELDTLQAGIDGKADTVHVHDIADVTDLQHALDDKADVIHQHVIGDVSGLRYELDLISSIVGGGTIFKHTHQIEEVLGLQTALDGKSALGHTHDYSQLTGTPPAPGAHTHTESDITGLGALARKNTIGNADIDNGSITQSKMAPNAVGATEIADNSVNGAKIALGGDTLGDIMVYSGTDWARLPAGVNGQLLQTFGPGAPPQWVNPPALMNTVQIAASCPAEAKGTQHDLALANGPYSALRIGIAFANGSLQADVTVNVQVFDGTTWGAAIPIYVGKGGGGGSEEFWIYNTGLLATPKLYSLPAMKDLPDGIATGVTTMARFTYGGGTRSTLKVKIVGYK